MMDVKGKLVDLKPCPFCGGEARGRTGVTSGVPKSSKAIVICQKCLASTDWFCDKGGDAEFVFEAIEAWNRRFDEQNKILDEQNVILAKLLELLEGKE